MSEWQPIETAPKDGRDILLWPTRWPRKKIDLGFWNDGSGSWSLSTDIEYSPQNPTHWMPLPEPPK